MRRKMLARGSRTRDGQVVDEFVLHKDGGMRVVGVEGKI